MQHKLSDNLINQMVWIRKPSRHAKPLEQEKNINKNNNNNKRRSDQERMDLNLKKMFFSV